MFVLVRFAGFPKHRKPVELWHSPLVMEPKYKVPDHVYRIETKALAVPAAPLSAIAKIATFRNLFIVIETLLQQ